MAEDRCEGLSMQDSPGNGADTGAADDRRSGGARHMSVMRIIRLDTPTDQGLCLVRNISSGGLMAHIYGTLAVGDRVIAHFKSGYSIAGKVVWQRTEFVGVQFDKPVDVAQLLSSDRNEASALPPRPPRVSIDLAGRVRVGAVYRNVRLTDISQRGCRIETTQPIAIAHPVVVTTQGLPAISGKVRWFHEDQAGIAFDHPVAFADLARWLAELNSARRAASLAQRQASAASEVRRPANVARIFR